MATNAIFRQMLVRLQRNATLVNRKVYNLANLKIRGFRKHKLTVSSERISGCQKLGIVTQSLRNVKESQGGRSGREREHKAGTKQGTLGQIMKRLETIF